MPSFRFTESEAQALLVHVQLAEAGREVRAVLAEVGRTALQRAGQEAANLGAVLRRRNPQGT
ncbi:MAG TPA: hypothetical protein VNZ52_14615 [Candidatus Thermoplasmatota archaeon]|nr:hypothetical protein [Candidatus Thermoplasmatota archaeon]